ncbi:MAG: ABC transporter ATP-binding protein [candidate division KSB1 bacterium]|nr:ABC transporter ATP-binding protein [candidate division KSB1 bacterium]MDZ7272722.1 ABC transporter ATP-binding protein [candidate division KSB1 bacterium]MDZ7284252.1 ABC transporter ATP-binding protein [candidate division KSB1 bacterium]MDZ7297349.1 ABC transporter ATP-binding protein [candidate division KSB1 bacterium]MDZ7307058.1 ABC transporter ATP-binding protein [candidate division KSB1 bacterium]
MIRLEDVSKIYGGQGQEVVALREVNLTISAGQFLALYGASGSGKSTLLNLIAGIDRPTHGRIFFDGVDLTALNETALTLLRREKIGFVFQFFNLLPTLTVLENVLLPAQLRDRPPEDLYERGRELLQSLGVADRLDAFPDQLSGGQQQRVAIARALINDPVLILADEPTGNLDSATGDNILALLQQLAMARGKTVLLVTHSLAAARFADSALQVRDGRILPFSISGGVPL